MTDLPPPPPVGGSMDPKQAKANAKAAKAHAKALRPWYKKKRFMIPLVLVVLVIAISAGSGGDDEKTASNKPSSSSDTSPEDTSPEDTSPGGQDIYAVGETASTGDFEVTLMTVEDPFTPSNEFETPPEGQRLVAVELTMKNTTDDSRIVSSLLSFEVKDSENRAWNITLAGLDLPQIDGDVPANETRRGWAVFAVDESAAGLTLRVKGNLTATGSLFQL